MAGRPFIIKGVMTVKGALKALEAVPATTVPHNYQSGSIDLAKVLVQVGKKEAA